MSVRMQQRRGTAEQWTTLNPTLAAGEIGFETDTYQFKIGDGVNNWASLPYFETLNDIQTYVDNAVAGIIDSAPETLNTLNELAAAIGDDSDFATTILNGISNGDAATLASAQTYTDTQNASQTAAITAAYEAYADSATTDMATTAYVDAADAATLIAANSYTDSAEANAISTSNTYTDNQIAALADEQPHPFSMLGGM